MPVIRCRLPGLHHWPARRSRPFRNPQDGRCPTHCKVPIRRVWKNTGCRFQGRQLHPTDDGRTQRPPGKSPPRSTRRPPGRPSSRSTSPPPQPGVPSTAFRSLLRLRLHFPHQSCRRFPQTPTFRRPSRWSRRPHLCHSWFLRFPQNRYRLFHPSRRSLHQYPHCHRCRWLHRHRCCTPSPKGAKPSPRKQLNSSLSLRFSRQFRNPAIRRSLLQRPPRRHFLLPEDGRRAEERA
jgi:hypothetical protein